MRGEGTGRSASIAALSSAAAAFVVVSAAAACARMSPPPGGPEDRIPPQVVATTPDTFEVVEAPYRRAVRFRFNERISERPTQGTLSDAVVVSPRTGRVRVEHNRESLEVSMIGGFRAGLVYRITLKPVIRDMFQNSMLDAFELVFSTGPEPEPYVIAGRVLDRITGEPVEEARVDAVLRDPGPDTLVHTAVTDSGGVFAMRYVPPGAYRVTAFQDRNRDGELDDFESRGRGPAILDPPADTSIIEVAVLEPDTTPARVVGAEVVDSTAIRIETDDHLDARGFYLDSVTVRLSPGGGEGEGETSPTEAEEGAADPEEEAGPGAQIPEDSAVPAVDSLFHAHRWERRLAMIDSLERARADSLARIRADSLTSLADSLAALGDSAAADSVRTLARREAPPGGAPSGGGRSRPTEPPRAEQEFVALLDRPLPVNVPFQVVVEGVENINGVPGGGGEASVARVPPPDTSRADSTTADTAAADTTAAPADTASAPDDAGTTADTTGAAADTTSAPDAAGTPAPDAAADSAAAEPDTSGVAPDTTGTPRDTARAGARAPPPDSERALSKPELPLSIRRFTEVPGDC